jgi:hypothetical protein
VNDRSQLKFAAAALVAGLAWGYFRHRDSGRRVFFAVLQALEWFVAYGGAAAVLALLRETMEPSDDDPGTERITHFRQVVTERTGTDG